MKQECGHHLLEKEVCKLDQVQLFEHHNDVMNDIAWAAREISNLQSQIQFLTERVEEVELEIESRDAKENGQMN